VKSRFFLNIVVWQGSAIFQLFSGEDQTLLIRRNSFFVLDLGLNVLDGVRGFDLQGDGFSGQGLDEDLHTSPQPQNQVKSGLFLDIIIAQGSAIFQLFSGEDQTLLIRRNSFFVLDFGLHIFNGVRCLNFQSNSLASQGLDEDLHSSSQPQDQVKSRFFLNIVVWQGSAIFQLFSGEDQTLLIRRNSFFVLDLGLNVLDGVRGFDLQGDGFSGQGLDEDLHSSPQPQDQMQSRFFLDIVVWQCSAIFQLFSGKDQTLLIWRNSLLILDLCLDIFDGIWGFDLKGDGFTG